MNQKGFGLKEFVIIFAVGFICILIISSIYQSIVPNAEMQSEPEKEKITYKDLEDELKQAAERYQNDTYSGNSSETAVWELSYSMLRKEKYFREKLIDPQ